MRETYFDEVEVAGDPEEIASFRLYLQGLRDFIVEETDTRIRLVVSAEEIRFLGQFNATIRKTDPNEGSGKVFIFLRARGVNANNDSLARSLNR